ASMGLVEVSGLAVGPHTMPAPITGHPCFYYRTTAWQLKQSGNRKEWEKVANESLHLPFFIDDNTGKVLVDPDGAGMVCGPTAKPLTSTRPMDALRIFEAGMFSIRRLRLSKTN